jgi:hypothetical protein
MSEEWQYQIRYKLTERLADLARRDPGDPSYKPLGEVLAKHGATAISTYDAFVNYVNEAEKNGVERYPLYKWTKATIDDPAKKAKHSVSFAVYVDGAEVYDKARADALEADLRPLADKGVLVSLSKHDTNPANNPQAPAHLR